MKGTVLSILLLTVALRLAAQPKYIDRAGTATFFSSAPIEDIEAVNKQAVSILDVASGEVIASMLIKSFNFRKSLMQEHFNENYLESDKYPKATFQGKVSNMDRFRWNEPGTYSLLVNGNLTIHGVTKPLQTTVEARVKGDSILTTTKFMVKLKDFNVAIPRLVIKNIAEEVEVTATFRYAPMKQ